MYFSRIMSLSLIHIRLFVGKNVFWYMATSVAYFVYQLKLDPYLIGYIFLPSFCVDCSSVNCLKILKKIFSTWVSVAIISQFISSDAVLHKMEGCDPCPYCLEMVKLYDEFVSDSLCILYLYNYFLKLFISIPSVLCAWHSLSFLIYLIS